MIEESERRQDGVDAGAPLEVDGKARDWLASNKRFIYPAVFFVLVLAVWEVVVTMFDVPRFIMPAPSAIAGKFFATGTGLWRHARLTMFESILGFALAVITGLTLAILISRFEVVQLTIYPYLIALSTIPVLAIAPLLILWFGFGILPKIIVSALISFLPIVINTMRGLEAVDYRLLELMYSLSASQSQVYRKIRFYTALPYIFAALKVSIAGAVVGAVVGEFLGSDTGLGYLIIRASSRLDTPLLFMSITLLGILGVSLFLVITLVEKKVLHWYDGSTIL